MHFVLMGWVSKDAGGGCRQSALRQLDRSSLKRQKTGWRNFTRLDGCRRLGKNNNKKEPTSGFKDGATRHVASSPRTRADKSLECNFSCHSASMCV